MEFLSNLHLKRLFWPSVENGLEDEKHGSYTTLEKAIVAIQEKIDGVWTRLESPALQQEKW